MMIIEQQRQVLANLLLKPEIAAYVEIDDSWFIDRVDRQIINVIANSPGISSHTDIERAVRNIDPFSPVSEDLLFNIASDGEYLDTLAKTETLIESIKIHTLKISLPGPQGDIQRIQRLQTLER